MRPRRQHGWGRRAALVLCLLPLACRVDTAFHEPDPGLNRMLEVPRYDIYEESQFFDDHMTMRRPPEGTITYAPDVLDPVYLRGQRAGVFTSTFPLELTQALIERGRGRYSRICAACHGVDGYGNEMVIQHMQRPAPVLHQERLRELTPGKLFFIISNGYGYMPAYATKLDVQDRWAVVAYVKALQRSQYAVVTALPPRLRKEVEARLR